MSAYQNRRLSAGLLLAGSLWFGTGFIGLRLDAQPTAEITWNGESAVVTIRGTEAGKNYQILSRTDLVSGPWVIEQDVGGAEGQSWTQTTVSMEGRPTLYMVAGYGEDSDGDGLSDVYEILVTRTSPDSTDTGNTGISDTYKDPDGDEWTNLHEYRLRTDPLKFDPPRAPTNVRATMDQGATTATLRWHPLDGAVLEYIVEREIAPWSGQYEEIGRVAGNQAAFVDSQADRHKLYRVAARYQPGNSSFSQNVRVNQADVRLAPASAAIIRGPQGQLFLVVSALPQVAASLRIARNTARAWYPLFDYNPNFSPTTGYEWEGRVFPSDTSPATLEIPVSQLSDGVYPIPVSFAPDFGRYRFSLEVITSDGTAGEAWILAPSQGAFNLYEQNKIPFLDGAAHLKQNLMFWLKAANASEAFRYSVDADGVDSEPGLYNFAGNPNYVSVDFYRREEYWNRPFPDNELVIDEFRPFQENLFLRNWIYQPGHLDSVNNMNTGVGYDCWLGKYNWLSRDTIFNERYVFPVYDYVTMGDQTLLQPVLPATDTKWIYHEDLASTQHRDDPRIGITRSVGNLQLASGLRNVFGLAYVSLKIGSDHAPYPISTVFYGQQYSDAGFTYFGSTFQEVEDPILQTESYYFAGSGDPMPGDTSWDVNNQTPLLIASAGQLFAVAGWAKQRIANGYTNKVAYLGQYFDKAFKVDPTTGQRTTQETGLLSEYGEFFPTEPGRVILTTKPDPDQGSLQGECLIDVIKIQLDVNHDGEIDRTFAGPDNTSHDRPFRFWINNDCDLSHGSDPGQDVRVGSGLFVPSAANLANKRIDCKRDLEDFARLWICGVPALAANPGYQVTLSWNVSSGSPAINLFHAAEKDGGIGYLTKESVAGSQILGVPDFVPGPGNKVATISTAQSFTLPSTFFANSGDKYFLFEGAGIGQGELVMTFAQGPTVLAETSAWLDLRDAKDLYEQAHIEGVNDSIPNTLTSSYKMDKVFPPDTAETKQIIVWVHGWNNSLWAAQSYAETAFKRLYWQGYRGRFVFLRWPTHSGETDTPPLNLFTYNHSEHKAFHSGKAVSKLLNDLRSRFSDYSINACAHSMGNIVMMEALKRQAEGGFQALDSYVLMEAAVPAHCFDSNAPDFTELVGLETTVSTPDTYRGYLQTANSLRGGLVNFFNQDDFALNAWVANQKIRKPHRSLGYSSDGTNGYHDGLIIFDPKELMPFVARSRSLAVGAEGLTRGAVEDSLNMKIEFGFTTAAGDHSGQYTRSVQDIWPFYRRLMEKLGL